MGTCVHVDIAGGQVEAGQGHPRLLLERKNFSLPLVLNNTTITCCLLVGLLHSAYLDQYNYADTAARRNAWFLQSRVLVIVEPLNVRVEGAGSRESGTVDNCRAGSNAEGSTYVTPSVAAFQLRMRTAAQCTRPWEWMGCCCRVTVAVLRGLPSSMQWPR